MRLRVPGAGCWVLSAGLVVAMATTSAYAQAPAQPLAKPAPGQAPGAAAAPPGPGTAEAPAGSQPANAGVGLPQPENYTYNADGRRDPFTTLIGVGASAETRANVRGEGGASSIGVTEISVRGIMQSRGSLVAMVEGPNKKTYIVHQGDKLLDGVIKTITPQGLVVIQEVNDPLSLVKQREVSKLLRSLEGGK